MEIILAVVIAIVAGAVAGYLFGKRGVVSAEQKRDALQDEVVALQVERGELMADKKHLAELRLWLIQLMRSVQNGMVR